MNPVLQNVDRNTRRSLLKAEADNRERGTWGDWEVLRFPRGTVGRTWAAGFTTAHKNKVFSVLDRTLHNGIRHLAVASLSGVRPSWHEMQRIKDELAGCDKTAVEVYPPATEIVDEADMFHIWVLTERLPFSIFDPGRPVPKHGSGPATVSPPRFLTQWERDDYERGRRGEKPLGPAGASTLSPALCTPTENKGE